MGWMHYQIRRLDAPLRSHRVFMPVLTKYPFVIFSFFVVHLLLRAPRVSKLKTISTTKVTKNTKGWGSYDQLSEKIGQLKMLSSDGKFYATASGVTQ